MDVKYINSVIETFNVTLEQFGVHNIKRCNIQKKNKMYLNLDLSTIVCFQGAVQGDIALSMPLDTAKNLASVMMMGMSITVIDNMAKSAIGELSSIIASSYATKLSSFGLSTKINPPRVILENAEINSIETLVIDFETDLGKMELNIGLNIS
ncbi:chemotaxis protein CheX [Anaerocolumna aminovalerica]|jgi:chemotaxis protein CheX|uniref:Chemotaxis protein CheX n=1 Tax=Anaerocolumna aminovalerica TaxID=1527 RepID=A0A1I5CFU8_9FIRM|nr:chemotaxis protein CheX [Anaerocolumna aminovalerica]MBU5333306.1 chemotaxis protein CheX [Anaerocolumna aminovalerica]MDU6265197.1 chemotaxis protein CheX [Anaerocolumna aminovalerica]SFN85806.1 chemotaxis protein CheX [Anaerocolumna aminovalerica]